MSPEQKHLFEQATGMREEPGWVGWFTRRDAIGAWRAGTPIVKVKTEHGDANPVGTRGVVLGSLCHPDIMNGNVMYFIEWDQMPRHAVACIGWKIGAAQ